jgi:parallel beta-helix repeat protein
VENMKKITVLVIVIGMLLTSSIASVNAISPIEDHDLFIDIYVDDDAPPGGDGSYEHPFQTIQEGVDAASDGDGVFVFSGIYEEDVQLNSSIFLLGENKDDTLIKAQRAGIKINADSVTVKGFRITRHPDSESEWFDGIFVGEMQKYANIQNNIVIDGSGTWFSGIAIYGSKYSKIQNNDIINGFGRWCTMIDARESTNLVISNNRMINGEGIFVKGISLYDRSDSNIVTGNEIKNMYPGPWQGNKFIFGIDVSYSCDNIITDNLFEDISTNYLGAGVYLDKSWSNTVSGNIFRNNELSGIHLSNGEYIACRDNRIVGNVITDCRYGILLHSMIPINGNNMFYDNDIKNNDVGIYLCLLLNNNTILSNNIHNNNIGVYLEGVSNNTIVSNTISKNNYGIRVKIYEEPGEIYYPKYNTITENDVTENNIYGAFVGKQVDNNSFYYNNFAGNGGILLGGNARDKGSNTWDDGSEMGNYWDSYIGRDLDGDGIGDVPHLILPLSAGNKDNYPLMSPYP